MKRKILLCTLLLSVIIATTAVINRQNAAAKSPSKINGDCTFNGIKLYGKVQVVDAFPDIKVQVVDAFPDLKVQVVDVFPDECGKWQFVDVFPDFKVQFVDAFPDIKIQYVDVFPGQP
jgi:hypothetical protein